MSEAKPKPKCSRCKRASTWKHLEAHDGMHADCERISNLPQFSEALALRVVRDARGRGVDWDRVLTELRRSVQPPPFDRYWCRAGEWHTLDAHDYGTRTGGIARAS